VDQNAKNIQDINKKITLLFSEMQEISSCFNLAADVCEKLSEENGRSINTQNILSRAMINAIVILKKQNLYMATLLHLIEMSNNTNFEFHCLETISSLRKSILDTQTVLQKVLPDLES